MVFLVSGLLLILGVKIVTKLEFLPLLVAIKDSWKDDPMTQGMYGVGGIGLLYVLFKELKSLAALPLAKELKTYLKLPSYGQYLGTIPVMAEQIKKLCSAHLGICHSWFIKKTHRRLLFVIDDLDRCGIDAIVKTFEAVRLVLELDNVIVIIAVDQRIALPALACHYKQLSDYHESDPKGIARDYLAKVINLPIELPAPNDINVAAYLGFLWGDDKFVGEVHPIEVEENTPDRTTSETNENTDKPSSDEPEETLEEIMEVINTINVEEILSRPLTNSPENIDQPKVVEEPSESGLSEQQKRAFYDWLMALELRNPRQIKRLYNSYNLLRSAYGKYNFDDDISESESNFPLMVALFTLEFINVQFHQEEHANKRSAAKKYLFKDEIKSLENVIDEKYLEPLSRAQQIFSTANTALKNKRQLPLLNLVEAYVLPTIESNKDFKNDEN